MTHQHLQSSSSSSPSSSSSSSQECGIIVIVITRVWTHRHQGHRGSTSSSTRYSTQLQCFTDCIKFLLRMLVFIIIIWLNGQSDGHERRSNAFFFLRVWWEKYLPATDSFYFNFLLLFFSIIIWLNGQSDGDERRSNTFFLPIFSFLFRNYYGTCIIKKEKNAVIVATLRMYQEMTQFTLFMLKNDHVPSF